MKDLLAEIPLKWRVLVYIAFVAWAVVHKR